MKEKEKLLECEVKRRRRSESGSGYTPFWKIKTVQEAVEDGDSEFRCKDCHGAVKLFTRRAANGPASYVEHKIKQDSEYCPAGMHFLQAEDGRAPRLSEAPVA
jgi:hypothetical protein